MKFAVPAQPMKPGCFNTGMAGKIPVKTITAERGEKNKSRKMKVSTLWRKEDSGLYRHDSGTGGNKQVTVNKKGPAGF